MIIVKRIGFSGVLVASALLQFAGTGQPAHAAGSVCVNPGGTQGCYAKIQDAVNAVPAHSTILVLGGVYSEDVVIGKSLSLLGVGPGQSFINAAHQANGIFIDGLDNAGLQEVVISGFTIHSANFEGVLVVNATRVTIQDNEISNNDLALDPSTPACPGLPSFETDEIFDCGGGLHLMGVTNSLVSNNTFHNNADGLLISDDSAATFGNIISNNTAHDNPTDCGIVMASHPPLSASSTAPHFGVYNNTLNNNTSSHNGYSVPGAGAGIGIFADGTGPGRVSGNMISHNTLINNGLPGVAIHSHVCCDNLNNNVIFSNMISGNGPDVGDTPTPGPTGINVNSGFGGTLITGTMIEENTIENETVDIAVNTPALVTARDNSLSGGNTGADNLGSGTLNVVNNWWGCATGPGTPGCSSVGGPNVFFTPWLTTPI